MPFDGRPERPLLMKGPLVVQTMEGLKTETRRIGDRFRKWKRGDLIYVRETFQLVESEGCVIDTLYRATDAAATGKGWKPGIHMPKWASRVWMELVEDVRYEPLQNITREGVFSEGVTVPKLNGGHRLVSDVTVIDCFARLWDSINSARGYSWADNPGVAVIRYRLVSSTGRPA